MAIYVQNIKGEEIFVKNPSKVRERLFITHDSIKPKYFLVYDDKEIEVTKNTYDSLSGNENLDLGFIDEINSRFFIYEGNIIEVSLNSIRFKFFDYYYTNGIVGKVYRLYQGEAYIDVNEEVHNELQCRD